MGVGHYKIGLYLEVISMHFGVFSGEYFLGCYTFKYLFGVLEILDIFGGLMVDAGPELTYKEKMRITPTPWCLSISSNLSLLNAYKWAFVLVGFCPSGLLS